jgi:NAD(P)-dependent dehydrogenase (short-subunit alcohol dehydrogenase family)
VSAPVVLVTGASRGIGAALARRLAGAGARLMLHRRAAEPRDDALAAVAREAAAAGAEVATATGDLAEPGTGEALVAATHRHFGRLDQVVANAGFADRRAFSELDRPALDHAHAAMTGGFFDLATAARPALAASPVGRVVAVSSFAAHVFPPDQPFPATAAAKAAVEALVRSLAVDLAPTGCTVNAVAPGFTRKDAGAGSALDEAGWAAARRRTPSGRIAEPDDVAAVIAFLLRPEARHVTGQVIHVDGGLGLV